MRLRDLSFCCVAFLAGNVGLLSAQAPSPRDLPGTLPSNGGAEQVVSVDAGKRTLYLTRSGELWTFDHATSKATLMVPARVWDVSLSPKGDHLAYVKGGEARTDHFIYVRAIDAPASAERRLTATQGDSPSFSPDGKLVAFAHDDENGVGQSLVVVPLSGGKEKTVADAMPGSIRSISWSPDGKTIWFVVNPPVPCVPEWSCLPLGESKKIWGSVRKVAAGGGTVTTVIPKAGAQTLGMSPDGSTIVYQDTESARRLAVADAEGTTRTSLTLSQTQRVQAWGNGGATLIIGQGNFGRGVQSLSAVDLTRRP